MSIKLRIISDVHCEFGPLDLPVMEGEDQQVLIVAGDLGVAAKPYSYVPFLIEWSRRFRDVIYVLGNHEHYDCSVVRSLDKIKERLRGSYEDILNVHVVNNEVVRVDNVSFVCSTLWASYDKQSPTTMYDAGLWMNDHKKIRNGPTNSPYLCKFRAADAYERFCEAINFIFPTIEEEKAKGQRVVVVTHHGCSWQSVDPRYNTGVWAKLNGAYVSDLDDDIVTTKPDIWVHGHVHNSLDYMIGDTRVIVNPRGYVGHQLNDDFDPTLVVEV
jgi:predicted phosphodiesterase